MKGNWFANDRRTLSKVIKEETNHQNFFRSENLPLNHEWEQETFDPNK